VDGRGSDLSARYVHRLAVYREIREPLPQPLKLRNRPGELLDQCSMTKGHGDFRYRGFAVLPKRLEGCYVRACWRISDHFFGRQSAPEGPGGLNSNGSSGVRDSRLRLGVAVSQYR
jgi:hypothetical protein